MRNLTHIASAVFIKAIRGSDEILEDGKPQVAFIGRSNVGKSSVINSLVGKELARSSKKPGKTVSIDLFLINKNMYFVDLPGYGYADRSKKLLKEFREMISWYLFSSGVQHKLVVLVVDSYVGFTDFDKESIELLITHRIPFLVVANKVDKLKRGERAKRIEEMLPIIGDAPIIPYSSFTKEGIMELQEYIGVETQ